MEEILLRVERAFPDDRNKGLARLTPEAMLKIGVSPGDIIEIEGKRVTPAKVWRADKSDWGKEIIRIDPYTRENAGVHIGDWVKVRKAEVREAEEVVLALPESTEISESEDIEELIKRSLLKRAVVKGDAVPVVLSRTWASNPVPVTMIVVSTVPSGVVLITEDTEIELRERPLKGYERLGAGDVTYEDIGGLKEEIQKVREMIELPLRHPEIFQKMGIDPPKGVILYGPPGTGKTLLAKAVANEAGASFFSIAGPEIMSKYYGESERQLREIFERARNEAPSIIFIDELDSIAPKRDEVSGEVEHRVVAQLLALMDGLEERGQVIVIGATNRINAIDPALRRPGRFDREIEIGVPDKNGRREIFRIHMRNIPIEVLSEEERLRLRELERRASEMRSRGELSGELERIESEIRRLKEIEETRRERMLDELVEETHGFVGADIAALCREAVMRALRRYLPEMDLEKELNQELLERMHVTIEDFREALKEVEPSAMREIFVEVPEVRWDDIGGLEDVKQELKEAVEWPLKHPEKFEKMGIKPPKGVLLYGPPGTGKTLLAKAVANESNANFIYVKGPEILSKWVGESEKAIREIFRRARQVSPCIIFFDEIDAIAPFRGFGDSSGVSERITDQLLTEMDGLEEGKQIIVLAATNRPDILDPALLRPGRFDRLVLLRAPNREERKKIFEIHTRKMPLAEDVSLEELAEITEGYVGSDIEAVCKEAGMLALREDFNAERVHMRHFREALKKVKPTATEQLIKYYERVAESFKGGLHREHKTLIEYG
ncbi:MAG: transitional endoplasmic reticulum ATPase [Archaeoglobi archaeon]|nr:transitional endoplasmic reticulum ATPase [Archaeoglobi archaeon]MDK2781398.1 transitional endoplasmic reticulum ATPase [Archaeoglobi archaeon]